MIDDLDPWAGRLRVFLKTKVTDQETVDQDLEIEPCFDKELSKSLYYE